MVDFKIVLSDPQTGKSYKLDATGGSAGSFIGKKIGDELDGGSLGLAGYTLAITGGTDRTGIPARRDLPGTARKRLLLSDGPGMEEKYAGERRRKSVRGSEITGDFVQINAKIVKYGEKGLKSIFEGESEAAE
ncbi:MAG: 30S ribosomal protein S6e [Methanomicrobiales archaeon]|nr:30S ribosomal protein S6e [Methanomicrobiales archaeon]